MTEMYTPSVPRDNLPKKNVCSSLLVQLIMQKVVWNTNFHLQNTTVISFSMLTVQTGLPPTGLPPNQPTSQKVINMHNFGIFQPIWLKFGMESLNGRPQHMYMIYMHLSMLTGQTDLPPNQPTGLKVKNLRNFVIFQLIWLKLGMESPNGRTQHMHTIYPVKPAYHPTSLPA